MESKPPVGIATWARRVSLRPQIHSQRLPSFLHMNNIGVPTDNLEVHFDSMIVDVGALK